jgi:hypothetical protein
LPAKKNNLPHFPNQRYINSYYVPKRERERERVKEREREREREETKVRTIIFLNSLGQSGNPPTIQYYTGQSSIVHI